MVLPLQIASQKVKVVITDVLEEAGQEAAKAINSKYGPGICKFIKVDVGQYDENVRLIEFATKEFGSIDVCFLLHVLSLYQLSLFLMTFELDLCS